MDTKITKEWGYRILSPTSLNFYHIILPQIGIKNLSKNLRSFRSIELMDDKSVILTTETPLDRELLIQELEELLKKMELQFAQTQKFTYKITVKHKVFLKNWFLSIEGGIALIAIAKCEDLKLGPYDFELIDSPVGGIYLHPFTILFNLDHAKVIHPIKISNFFLREQIEKVISVSMRGILQRADESQRGFEGLALLSYIQERTGLSPKLIGNIINEKARMISMPKYSSLLV